MAVPARAGILIYARAVNPLACFYQQIAGMRRVHAAAGHIILQSDDIQLLVHRLPEAAAAAPAPSAPPRRDIAIKFFLTVPSIDAARARAHALGGDVFCENHPGPGFVICNAVDPEGNVFQLREFVGA